MNPTGYLPSSLSHPPPLRPPIGARTPRPAVRRRQVPNRRWDPMVSRQLARAVVNSTVIAVVAGNLLAMSLQGYGMTVRLLCDPMFGRRGHEAGFPTLGLGGFPGTCVGAVFLGLAVRAWSRGVRVKPARRRGPRRR